VEATLAKVVVAGVLGAHGIGHVMGWLPILGLARIDGVESGSWLLTSTAGEGVARVVALCLFVVPTVGFMAAAAGLMLGQPWWRSMAVAAAATSLAASALYPQALPVSSTIGSVVVDCTVLFGILVAGWGADAATA
jgi:hypothetical protein